MILYIEEQVFDHHRTKSILAHFPRAKKIIIKHYKNIFDRTFPQQTFSKKQENIRVLAKLTGKAISQAPDGYGHGQEGRFFKTTLNCVFDCQYCYLKGSFKNNFPVVFVNYEDIAEQIIQTVQEKKKSGKIQWWYMSDWSDTQGFDRLLATHEYFFKVFEGMQDVMCETRTKARDIKTLLDYAKEHTAPQSIEIAYSLNPESLIREFETGTASLDQRIDNINALLDAGYKVGLRFMPLLPVDDYMNIYSEFLNQVIEKIDMNRIYSSFAGGLLYTKNDYKKIAKREPQFQKILDRLSDAGDGYYRESMEIRQNFYELFQSFISNCFICLDEYK